MADLAGAMAAMEAKFAAAWGSTTPYIFDNDSEMDARDPVTGQPVPWIRFSIENEFSDIRGAGKPKSHVNIDEGQIVILVSVPAHSGRARARELAQQAGEIFRTESFYRDTPGFEVRTWMPHMGRALVGRSENPEGLWYVISVSIPYEFYSIA